MTARERELTDVGLAGPPRQHWLREDPAWTVRWQRAIAEGAAPIGGLSARVWRGGRRLFLEMFPTRWDRLGALAVFVAIVYIFGFVVPQAFGVPLQPDRDVAAGRAR